MSKLAGVQICGGAKNFLIHAAAVPANRVEDGRKRPKTGLAYLEIPEVFVHPKKIKVNKIIQEIHNIHFAQAVHHT